METILWKISMDNSMERGARLGKFVVLKNVGGAALYVWNNYGARARVVLQRSCNANSQLAIRTYGTKISDHSEYQTMVSDRREFLLQVRTNEVSEHMLQKRPKGAPSDWSSERSERQRERQATEGSAKRPE